MNLTFPDKTVIVTGAAHGFGRAISLGAERVHDLARRTTTARPLDRGLGLDGRLLGLLDRRRCCRFRGNRLDGSRGRSTDRIGQEGRQGARDVFRLGLRLPLAARATLATLRALGTLLTLEGTLDLRLHNFAMQWQGPQLAFQGPDPLAHRWLCQVQPLRGPPEVQLLRDGHEDLEGLRVDHAINHPITDRTSIWIALSRPGGSCADSPRSGCPRRRRPRRSGPGPRQLTHVG